MPNAERRSYEFGPFRIDTAERLLFRGQEMVPLTPKVIDTLLVLISSPGSLLDKDEILELVYPGIHVEENAVAKNISALRKVIGDECIQTIAKRGYRFVAEVREVAAKGAKEEPVDAAGDRINPLIPVGLSILAVIVIVIGVWKYPGIKGIVSPGNPGIHSLAVLPLDNLTQNPAQEYFTEGMHEELINTLAKVEALRVISRTSAMTYQGAHKPLPQIARELNVDAIVEGSVLQSGNRVRIAVQLFGKDDKQLWAQSYEGDLRDVLALQGEVAGAIASEIQIKVTPQDKRRLQKVRQVSPESYLAYAHGRYYWNKRTPEGFQKAANYFQQAIAEDPSYAPAHSGLADAFSLSGSIGADVFPPNQVMPKAKAAALEAVRLDGNLAEGHTSLAYVKLSYDWDLEGANREFQQAFELNPGYATAHHWRAHYWLAKGKPDQALAEIRQAEVLDPFSFIISMGVGWDLYHARLYNQAIEKYRATLDLNPDFPLTHCVLGMALVENKSYTDALAEFNRALALPGSLSFALANIARTQALSGKLAEARQVLAQLQASAHQRYVPAIYLAGVYAALDENDKAITWAQKAYEERSDYMVYLKTEPAVDSLRSDPRFQRLLDRIAAGH